MEDFDPTDRYIDGEWTQTNSGETIQIEDLATEKTYSTVRKTNAANVNAAVQATAAAVEPAAGYSAE